MQPVYVLPQGLRRGCGVLFWLALATLAAYLVMAVVFDFPGKVIAANLEDIAEPHRSLIESSPTKDLLTHSIGWLSALSNALIPLGALGIFRAFSTGQVFDRPAVRAVSRLGWLIIANVAINTLTPTAMQAALTYDNAAGSRILTMSLSTNQVTLLLVGLVLLVVGHVYARAAQIADDHGQIV